MARHKERQVSQEEREADYKDFERACEIFERLGGKYNVSIDFEDAREEMSQAMLAAPLDDLKKFIKADPSLREQTWFRRYAQSNGTAPLLQFANWLAHNAPSDLYAVIVRLENAETDTSQSSMDTLQELLDEAVEATEE